MGIMVHTAQLNVGKCIPINSNVVFLNTTASSGKSAIERSLAPTWDLVKLYKDNKPTDTGQIVEEVYSERYLAQLDAMPPEAVKYLEDAAMGLSGITDIIVACYDGVDSFCHRHLLSRYLVDRFGFSLGYEVLRDNVSTVSIPNNSVLSLAKLSDALVEEVKEYVKETGGDGGVMVVDETTLKTWVSGLEEDYDRTTVNVMRSVNKMIRKAKKQKAIQRSYIDVTRLVDRMFVPDRLKAETREDVLGRVSGYMTDRPSWVIGRLMPDDKKGNVKTLKQLVGKLYQHTVSLVRTHHNLDAEAMMDTYYQQAKKGRGDGE